MLQWLEGGTFDPNAPDAASVAGQIGFLAARLHLHSRSWTPPAEFTRPSLDEPALARSMKRLHVAVDAEFITEREYGFYAAAADRIVEVMRSLGAAPNRWGLIHADLGAGNILVRGNDISPIDFSLSCFAHYLFDVGGCAAGLKSHLRAPFVAGYERMYPLAEEMRRAADALAMVSIIGCFGFLLPSPRRYDWLRRRIPEVAHSHCLDLVRGKPFILP
jgi:Ser/Thr protein kinase RdoA (MazF antagonist)